MKEYDQDWKPFSFNNNTVMKGDQVKTAITEFYRLYKNCSILGVILVIYC